MRQKECLERDRGRVMGVTRLRGRDVGDGTITDADVSVANKDGAAGIPCLRTLGTGVQQACGGADARLCVNDSFFTHSLATTSPLGPRYYVCGQAQSRSGAAPTATIPLNTAVYMPFIVTTYFTLRAVGIANTTAPAGTLVNLALYDSVGTLDLYPGTLLGQTSLVSLSSVGPPYLLTGLAIPLVENMVHWVAVVFQNTSPTCATLPAAEARPTLGLDATLSANAGIGYVESLPTGVFPATAGATLSPYSGNSAPRLVYAR